MSSGISRAAWRRPSTSSGSRYGAMVWITPTRNGPTSGSVRAFATALTLPASSRTRRACATTAAPVSVSSTSPGPRSNRRAPSSSSSFLTDALRLGWLTKQRSAARLKLRSSATATTYLSSVSVIGRIGKAPDRRCLWSES